MIGSGTRTFAYTYEADGGVLSENDTAYANDALHRLASWHDPVAEPGGARPPADK